jgi:hypothetical protein
MIDFGWQYDWICIHVYVYIYVCVISINSHHFCYKQDVVGGRGSRMFMVVSSMQTVCLAFLVVAELGKMG